MSVAEKLLRAKKDLNDVFEAGKKAEQNDFWEVFQDGGNPKSYYYAFSYNRFNDETYNPKYDIRISNGTLNNRNMFYSNNLITDTKVGIYVGTGTLYQCFYDATNLETIRLLSVFETTDFTPSAFNSCTSLKNITFEGVIGQDLDIHWSPLSKESIISIISHLSDTATGKTLTLNTTAVETGFEEEEWSTLVASKPNWTISLV